MTGFVNYKRHVRTLSYHRLRRLTHLYRAHVFVNSLNAMSLSDTGVTIREKKTKT